MLELTALELEPPKAALSPSQMEVPEDEEDYTGNEPEARGDSQLPRALIVQSSSENVGLLLAKVGLMVVCLLLSGSHNNHGNLHSHSSFHPRLC